MKHISSFPAYESHYSREKTEKKYLGPELKIEKMYSLYLEWCTKNDEASENVAKNWLYREIFNTKFKLSFKPPQSDTHDVCDEYRVKLKSLPQQSEAVRELISEQLNSHMQEAEKRYSLKSINKEMARGNTKHKVVTADLQKCLPIPLLTNCISVYKRNLRTLNYTICDSSDGTAFCMMWDESKGARGGDEISSAIWKWANNVIPGSDIKEITSWADNCYGQNKNMLTKTCFLRLLHKYPQIKKNKSKVSP